MIYTVIVLLFCKNIVSRYLKIQRVVVRLGMVSQNDGNFYGVPSIRNIVATKLLHISELFSCISPFVFYDSDFDRIIFCF